MTKVSIKVISVILCAVMVVGCCFVGCDGKPQYNEITRQEIYDAFKRLYPDARLEPDEHNLYLSKNSKYPCIGNYWMDLESVAIPEEFSFWFSCSDDNADNDLKKCLNCYLSLFYDDWSEENLYEFTKGYEDAKNHTPIYYDYYFKNITINVFTSKNVMIFSIE